MKTKKQLFKAAMTGPDPKYNTLLSILEVVTDQRNIHIACVVEEDGVDVKAVRAEMKRIYEAEIFDDTCKENCIYRDRKEHFMPACKFGGEPIVKNGVCKSYTTEEKDG